jgi:hypothetical protein
MPEDDENEATKDTPKFVDDFTMPSTEELRSTETWSNLLPMILKAGRTTHLEPVGMEEEEATALKEKLETEDP